LQTEQAVVGAHKHGLGKYSRSAIGRRFSVGSDSLKDRIARHVLDGFNIEPMTSM